MPAKSSSQARLFRMAYAVRKGKLKRSDVSKSVIDLADSDISDSDLKDFFHECGEIQHLKTFLLESIIK